LEDKRNGDEKSRNTVPFSKYNTEHCGTFTNKNDKKYTRSGRECNMMYVLAQYIY
jgi:hypothetical protein